MDSGRRNRSPNRGRSHSADYDIDKNNTIRHRSGSGTGIHDGRSDSPSSNRYGNSYRHRNNPSSPIMRRSRSASRGDRRSHSEDWGRSGFHRGGDRSHRNRYRYPVDAYMDQPLLCENMWNDIFLNKKKHENDDGPLRPGEMNSSAMDKEENEIIEAKDIELQNAASDTNRNENSNSEPKDTEEEDMMDVEKPEKLTEETYEKYKNEYCLDYIRSFFNSHLDDEWFKQQYSPLHRKNFAAQMRNRAHAEANSIKEEITKHGDENNPNGAELFVQDAKLGIGKKPTGTGANNTKKRKKRSYSGADGDETNDISMENNILFRNPVPSSHILTGHAHCALEISDVPPYVTDAQLSHAVAEHSSSPPLRLCSTTVGFSGSGDSRTSQKHCNSLLRTVWAIFVTEEAKVSL